MLWYSSCHGYSQTQKIALPNRAQSRWVGFWQDMFKQAYFGYFNCNVIRSNVCSNNILLDMNCYVTIHVQIVIFLLVCLTLMLQHVFKPTNLFIYIYKSERISDEFDYYMIFIFVQTNIYWDGLWSILKLINFQQVWFLFQNDIHMFEPSFVWSVWMQYVNICSNWHNFWWVRLWCDIICLYLFIENNIFLVS